MTLPDWSYTTPMDNMRKERDALIEATRNALNELGIPDDNYPAPVANAVAILQAALPEWVRQKVEAEG